MSNQVLNDVSWLIASIMRGLLEFPDDRPGVRSVLSRIAEQDLSTESFAPMQPARLPACRHLPEAVAAGLLVSSDLCSAIANIEDQLHWTQAENYSDDYMGQPGFMANTAYAEVIGSKGFFRGDDFRLGLMLIGPKLHYRDHRHAASELYWLLTGPIEYSRDGEDFKSVGTAETIWHEPRVVHAMKTGDRPLLAVWAWTSNVDELSEIVQSS